MSNVLPDLSVLEQDIHILHEVVQGDENTLVDINGTPTPSLLHLQKELIARNKEAASEVIAGAVTNINDVANARIDEIKNTQGMKGTSATVKVGAVITGEPHTPVKITNSGTTNDAVLNFTIPRGADGTGDGVDPAILANIPTPQQKSLLNKTVNSANGIVVTNSDNKIDNDLMRLSTSTMSAGRIVISKSLDDLAHGDFLVLVE